MYSIMLRKVFVNLCFKKILDLIVVIILIISTTCVAERPSVVIMVLKMKEITKRGSDIIYRTASSSKKIFFKIIYIFLNLFK
jgi:hypothetical protein